MTRKVPVEIGLRIKRKGLAELREVGRDIRVLGLHRYLYARLIYREHMKLLHRFNKHGRRRRPIDGLLYCSWCGHLESEDGEVVVDGPAMMKRTRALVAEAKRTGKLAPPVCVPLPDTQGDSGSNRAKENP